MCLFAIQTYVGERGVQARAVLTTQIAGLHKKLAILQERRKKLEQKIKLLEPGRMDTEVLEFQAKELLGFAHPDERLFVQKNN